MLRKNIITTILLTILLIPILIPLSVQAKSRDCIQSFSFLDGLTLTEVKNGSDTLTNFSYDALGNRISKSNTTTNPTITKYVNDILAPNHLVLVEKPYNSTDKLNVWGPTGLISTGKADVNGRIYPLTDSQGTTRFLTDSKGKIIENHTYDPFGNKTNDITPSIPYLYTGENYDTETGL